MWRKALVLGLVLMAVGMIVSEAPNTFVIKEEGKFDVAYGIYMWHKTGDWKQAFYGAITGEITREGAKKAGATLARYATKRIIKRALIRTAVKTVAKALPGIGVALWA